MGTPDKGNPTNVLAHAKCIAVVPATDHQLIAEEGPAIENSADARQKVACRVGLNDVTSPPVFMASEAKLQRIVLIGNRTVISERLCVSDVQPQFR
jgi:hypothetical protein